MQDTTVTELLGNTNNAPNPLAQFQDMLPLMLYGGLAISVLVVILFIINTVMKYRSEAATIAMQRDIHEIRGLLEKQAIRQSPIPAAEPPQDYSQH